MSDSPNVNAESGLPCPYCGGTRTYQDKIGYTTVSWPYAHPEGYIGGPWHCIDCELIDGSEDA